MAGDAEANDCFISDAGDVWRSDRSVCCPGYVAIFSLGIRADPVYLLPAIWGKSANTRRRSSFTRLGSLFILVAALTMAFYGDTVTFDMRSLAVKDYALNFQLLVYAGFLIAYAVSCPSSHCTPGFQMPTGKRLHHMLLAGILLKMGGML